MAENKNTEMKSPFAGEKTTKGLESSLVNTIVISALFAVVVSIIMLFNYLQLASNDPIESATLSALVERLSDEPNNAQLQQEIRYFDLMARKAFFTSQWQIKTGAWLLLISAIVLVLSLRSYFSITHKIEKPLENQMPDHTARLLSSKWLLGIASFIIVLAGISSFLSVSQLDQYEKPIAAQVNSIPDETIEVVDLTQNETNNEISQEAAPDTDNTEIEKSTVAAEVESKPAASAVSYPSLAELNKQYNSFRGSLGNGVASFKNVPISWDVASGKNILWKVKVPVKGFSSPVIWNDKLFVTGANKTERWVYCYNKNNGQLLWQQQANNIPGSPATAPKTTDDTGLAAPSVVTNGMQVVAIFGTGDIIAFDMNGTRLWAKNLGVPDNHYGHSSSLLTWKEKVIVQYDTNKGGRLLTLNIQNGNVIWDVKRSSKISWASPILIEVNGKMQIVTSAEPTVGGFDLETGKELWKVDCMMGEVGPSPTFGNGLVFAANEYATLAAIDPAKGTLVWEDNMYLPEVSSPAVADGLIFIATTYGVFACFDVHTHNMYWETEFNEGFYSTSIIADGKVYAIDMKGVVHIMKVDRELKSIANISMGETVMTTPAFGDGRIYIRGNENLFAIGQP